MKLEFLPMKRNMKSPMTITRPMGALDIPPNSEKSPWTTNNSLIRDNTEMKSKLLHVVNCLFMKKNTTLKNMKVLNVKK